MIKTIKQLTSRDYLKYIWNHSGFQKYLRNTSWMFFGRFFTLGVSFFIGIYIARYLGPSNYGLFSYVISFVGLFGFLTSFGIDNIVSREIIKDHNKKDELIGTAFYMKAVGSLLAITSVFIVSLFTTKDIFTLGLVWIFSLSFIPQAFNVIEIYFQSQVLSKKVVLAQILSNIVSAVLKMVIISLDKGIFWLTIVYLIESGVYSGTLLFSFRKFGSHVKKWKLNFNLAKLLLKDSWPLMLSTVAVGIYLKIDQVMIKNMLGNEQAGIYAVAAKLSEVWYIIPSIICTSLAPSIVSTLHTDKILFTKRISKLYFLMFWLSFAIAIFITIFSHPIINILFGSAYAGAITVLQIYVWAGISVFLGGAVSQYLFASNLTKIFFYITSLGAIINIIINILLIPTMGINGAAIATLIAYSLATFGIFFFKESRKQGILILKSIINFK